MSIRKVAAKTRTFCGEIVILVEFDNEVDTDEYGNDDNSENEGNYKILMNLCGEVDILVVVDDEVICIRQSLLEAAHPLLGYRCHLRFYSH